MPNAVVPQRAVVFEQLASENQPPLVRRDGLLVLDLCFVRKSWSAKPW